MSAPRGRFGGDADQRVLAEVTIAEGSEAAAAKRFMVPLASVHRVAVTFELELAP